MNTEDQKLLELAARAYVPAHWRSSKNYMDGFMSTWNPLDNDGDAFRLMVDLKINAYSGSGSAGNISEAWEDGFNAQGKAELHKTNPLAATRRAIVRLAADIGGKMERE